MTGLSFMHFKNREDEEKRIKVLLFKKIIRVMYTYVAISSTGTQSLFKKYILEELNRQDEMFQSKNLKQPEPRDLVEQARKQ
jgi:hypothetical protein